MGGKGRFVRPKTGAILSDGQKVTVMKNAANAKFQAFADSTRLRILVLLRHREMCVCDLVDVLKVPQPTASRHLARLRRAGLVKVRKEGFWTFYALKTPRNSFHACLLQCLDHCFEDAPSLMADRKRAEKVWQRGSCGGNRKG